jgi:hypothetical protein
MGRGFLAGDAAHIHTPAGAQGMNTGIQDGYNLAWKLALVLKGNASERILETYNDERLENAKNLLNTTDRFFNLVASPEPVLAYLRTHVFPYIAGAAFSIDAVKKFVFPRISQIGINYRDSSLSERRSNKFRVKAGDRMPYFLISAGSVFDNLRQPKFHWLVFSDEQGVIETMKAELESEFGELVDFTGVALSPEVVEIFGEDQPFSLLLRPDNYIGYISDKISLSDLRAYLKRFAPHYSSS